jgi:phosphopantothenoylcysteine decarboxylase/phosphopantothenate--cysteine ligase
MLDGKQILLIISGGIAAYKSLELIRRLKELGAGVRCVLTESATHLVAPLSVAALSEERVFSDLFSLTDETEIGHIQLSREADLVVVAPATANLLAKMSVGIADDLASTLLLATDKEILVAPAMNVRMWEHPATQGNLEVLTARGVHAVGPASGDLACGESGTGRMAEPAEILDAVCNLLVGDRPLAGLKALVTSGPTHEPIDPVRYLANRSSGKQGHAIAGALARLGADTVLVSGPTVEPVPAGVRVVNVETAEEMLAACQAALPVDVAVCVAAVCDWRLTEVSEHKIKKDGGGPPTFALTENPDILATLSAAGDSRPSLVVGFAAETDDLETNARAKLQRKGCDWIIANDVSPGTDTMGGDRNAVRLVTGSDSQGWPSLTKVEVAARLADRIAQELGHVAKTP